MIEDQKNDTLIDKPTGATVKTDEKKGHHFRLFIVIWLGDLVSSIGSGLTAFALGVHAFKITGEATASALIVLFSFLPALILRPVGGVLADRFSRLALMSIGNLGAASGIILVLILISHYPTTIWILYPGVVLSSMFFALQNPAYKASVSDFVPPELYARVSGLVQLSSASQFLIAPLLAGILMSVLNISYVLMIDIGTFVFSALVIFIVKSHIPSLAASRKDQQQSAFFHEIRDGAKAITHNRGVFILSILLTVLLFYIGLIEALSIPLVLSFTSTSSLGIAQSISAIGMVLSSILVSSLQRKRKNVFVLGASLFCMGVCFAFIGITPNIWSIIVPSFLFFCAVPFANSSIDVLIRSNIDNKKQGRAWAMITVLTSAGSIIAYSISGFLADNVFNPLFASTGYLANNLGHFFGVGPGRGIAFMFFISGMMVVVLSIAILKSKAIGALEA